MRSFLVSITVFLLGLLLLACLLDGQAAGEVPTQTAAIPTSTTRAADIIQLDHLVNLYEPVAFPHKLHADMEVMGAGCAACHHHNPSGQIRACRECHGGPSNPANLGQPGIKGAYHRQCLGCHREWSHTINCTQCHLKRVHSTQLASASQVTTSTREDPTDFVGQLHPHIEMPNKRIYQTPAKTNGPMVTFHHQAHSSLYGLKCADCHKKENCGRCHDQTQPLVPPAPQQRHADCRSCHRVSGECNQCHATKEIPPFNHASRAGLELDEIHQRCTCSDCHPQGLSQLADCKTCHFDGRKFPDLSPGKVVPKRD